MISYCGNDTTFSEAWVDNGINRCFFETISSSFLFLFMIICGCIQCAMFRKYAIRIDNSKVKGGSAAFAIQVILAFVLLLEAPIHVILQDIAIKPRGVKGYQVLTALTLVVAWIGAIRLLFLKRNKALPSIPTRGHDFVLLAFWAFAITREALAFVSWESEQWWWNLESYSDKIEFGLWVTRFSVVILLFLAGIIGPAIPKQNYQLFVNDDEEGGGRRKKKRGGDGESTWSNIFTKLRMMLPYIWPKGSLWRQAIVMFCIVLLAGGRVINVFVPLYSKYVVNSLSVQPNTSTLHIDKLEFRWDLILIYCTLLFLKGGGTGTTGFLNNLRSFLWVPVQQYTTRHIQVKLFDHLHALSLRWHLQRKTGEVLRVIDRGTNSINSLLSYVVFQILPTIVDIIIAIVYFITAFNYIFGLVVFICMALYLVVTIYVTEWRTKYRRDMNRLDNEKNSRAVDSLLNFETVKYYGASKFESERYDKAIVKYQVAEWKSTSSLNFLNCGQNMVITGGVLAGSLLCGYAVVDTLGTLKLTVGDYVLFGTYLNQLYGPLNWLGTYYRMIQQSFIDMENMFDLLDEGHEIQDVIDAKPIEVTQGEIMFKDVNFHYEPAKQILRDINFTVPPGHTFALVGHSGSGKSTILRLLFRFYDIQGGTIFVDNQDISKVQQESLRQSIGVVPQDTVLFNDTIRYNIRYGKFTATDDDVEEAAVSADIHARIINFPAKYETMVGERGLKLSGGEKQRVAIARTLLKSPAVVLLDEATSALDTKTERNIQASLARVCENRTTLIVAHRLSTIIYSHQILVMSEGEIIERGTHEELLAANGHYASMWMEQQTKRDNDISSSNGDGSVTTVDLDEKSGGSSGSYHHIKAEVHSSSSSHASHASKDGDGNVEHENKENKEVKQDDDKDSAK